MVVGTRQSFQFLRQKKTGFLEIIHLCLNFLEIIDLCLNLGFWIYITWLVLPNYNEISP